jgi:beta-mannosidase
VGEEDWTYTGVFTLTASQLDTATAELDCEGLDTVAEVVINGVQIGSAANMFVR